ncbi:MAG TPA: putative maltokinase, partial [Nitrospirota bacterium]
CHMAFHFPIMPRLFMALQMEDRFPIMDILDQTPAIAETCQWGMFLRNHDELTLEMVTDEERDYMYRVYARDRRTRINLGIRRRLAPLMGNSRRKIELMNILLFSLPGTPIIYYGDEIGMGDNYYLGDRNGVRTPMQWSADRNAGFSKADAQKLYLPVIIDREFHYEALNVDNQERNLSSLLWWTKRVIAMRRRFKAFSRGNLTFPPSDNPKVLVFTRCYEGETILVVINLSRFSQVVEIDLSKYAGDVPVEVFSLNRFPAVRRDAPYVLTMGFHDYYWFSLEKTVAAAVSGTEQALPELEARQSWLDVFESRMRQRLEENILPSYLQESRRFGGKARILERVRVIDELPLDRDPDSARIVVLEAAYTDGPPEEYLLPLAHATGERAAQLPKEAPKAVLGRLRVDGRDGVLYDAVYDEGFRANLLRLIAGKKRVRGSAGELSGQPGRTLRYILNGAALPLPSQPLKVEQGNSSIQYGARLHLKLYRRIEEGPNPDVELSRFLTERAGFTATPPFAGLIEYHRPGREVTVIGQVQGYVINQGDAWTYTLDAVRRFFEHVLSEKGRPRELPEALPPLFEISPAGLPPLLQELIGGVYLYAATVLGRRTAELHQALADGRGDPAFEPEPFSLLYQRSLYQSMRNQLLRVLPLLQKNLKKLPEGARLAAARVLEREKDILALFHRILETKIAATTIRYHGDFHLSDVLYTGRDFVIIDFEGEPGQALSERRLKRSPLRDAAGMIRSFHYAVSSALLFSGVYRPEEVERLEPWADIWFRAVSGVYLNAYLFEVEEAPFVPRDPKEVETLLRCFLMERAVHDLGRELDNRTDWIVIPIRVIERLLKRA